LIYIKPENTEIADYVNWLEAQIQALRIHDVVGRSEQLCPDCGNTGRRLPQTLDSPDGQECECGA
jgi:RNA polymerase subunit RPABC4/transcription elongation factor Spt4